MLQKRFTPPTLVIKGQPGREQRFKTITVEHSLGGKATFQFNKTDIYPLINQVTKKLDRCDLWRDFMKHANMNILHAFCTYILFLLQQHAHVFNYETDDETFEKFKDLNTWYADAEANRTFTITALSLKFLSPAAFTTTEVQS